MFSLEQFGQSIMGKKRDKGFGFIVKCVIPVQAGKAACLPASERAYASHLTSKKMVKKKNGNDRRVGW